MENPFATPPEPGTPEFYEAQKEEDPEPNVTSRDIQGFLEHDGWKWFSWWCRNFLRQLPIGPMDDLNTGPLQQQLYHGEALAIKECFAALYGKLSVSKEAEKAAKS